MSHLRGLDKWIEEFSVPSLDPVALENELYLELKQLDDEEQDKLMLLSNPTMNASGFVQATTKKKRKTFGNFTQPVYETKEPTYVTDFYKFQKAETKQKQMEEIRKQFEEDKSKIQKLQQSRMFKPF
ncbi:putative ribosomal RNA-processing protein 7 [Blattamonas nauphoetae]|uniref:Ribosomal RNA-processing protein 7 n=1 Tax=Blattamonas nauphoetae TaxID=2049346 RepID=A0ABQ9YLY4_9EUKA|nr:putative ribosomal RNA-processing protein 7 [Blattamonas nauphoetae]